VLTPKLEDTVAERDALRAKVKDLLKIPDLVKKHNITFLKFDPIRLKSRREEYSW